MSDPDRRRSVRTGWPLAVTVIVVLAIAALSALVALRSLRSFPGEMVEGGERLLETAATVAAAFRTGTITTTWRSQAVTLAGTNYLQFATLDEVETFEHTDEASILWGQLALPDVVVEATAPVETTYYLDLDGEWRFEQEGDRVYVMAPRIRFNKPAIDASEIRYTVREGSILRDSDDAVARLKQGLTRLARHRAAENVDLVRELGRRKTEEFVETWLAAHFSDGGDFRAEVVFADEVASGEVARPGETAGGPQ